MPYPDPFSLPDLINGAKVPDYRLADSRAYFYLVALNLDRAIPIREPVGWDGAEWVIERDPTFHGMNFEFTGDEATLTFDEPAAVAFEEEAYHAGGPQIDFRLVWGLIDPTGELPIQTLKFKLETRSIKEGILTVKAERLSLHPQIQTRWDTTLSMDARQAIVNDGNLVPITITPPAPSQLLLHAQRIRQTTTIKDIDKPFEANDQEFINTGAAIIQGGGLFSDNSAAFHDFYFVLPFEK
jgi:hypothetical protein